MPLDKRESFLYQKLRQSSTEELENALRSGSWETGDDAADRAMLIAISDILLERDNTTPEQFMEETEKALDEFWKYYANDADKTEFDTEDFERFDEFMNAQKPASEPALPASPKRKRKRWPYWLAGAAVFVLVIGFPIAKAINSYFSDVVHHSLEEKEIYSSSDTYKNSIDATTFQALLDINGLPFSFKNLWTPEIFVGVEISTVEYPEATHYTYELRSTAKQPLLFEIAAYKSNDFTMVVESNYNGTEEYLHEDCIYQISKNTDNMFAITYKDNCKLMIAGDVTSEELHQIINSIE